MFTVGLTAWSVVLVHAWIQGGTQSAGIWDEMPEMAYSWEGQGKKQQRQKIPLFFCDKWKSESLTLFIPLSFWASERERLSSVNAR